MFGGRDMPWNIEERDGQFCVVKADGTLEKCHESEDDAKAHMAALYASETKEAVMKSEKDGKHPASHYLVVEDPEKPTTWHLRVKDMDGDLDAGLMGAAWAALHKGYRGNKYEGPDKQKAIAALRKLYKRQDRPTPGEAIYFDIDLSPRSLEAKADFEGREWDITIVGAKTAENVVSVDGRNFIRSRNNRLYDIEALKASTPMWEGVKVYDNHLTNEEFTHRAGMRSVAGEWIGSIVSPKWEGGKLPKLKGILKVVEESVARKLKNAWDQGILGTVGLSIDTLSISGQEAEVEGKRLPVVEGFEKILSVDLVAEPAAGGGFNRLIAAKQQEVSSMDKEQLKALVSQLVTEALAEKQVEDEKKEALIEAVFNAAEAAKFAEAEDPKAAIEPLVKAMILVEAEKQEPPQEPEPVEPEPQEPEPQSAARAGGGLQAEDAATQEQIRKLECKIILRDKLDAAKLTQPMREMVDGMYDGKVFEEADLDAAIKRAKEAEAAIDGSGRVSGAGGGQVQILITPQEKAEVEFMRLVMGNSEFRALESVEDDFVKERVSEAYHSWVKAGRPKYSTRRLSEWVYESFGDPFESMSRFYEASTTTSMSSIVKNAMNVMLANDYAKRQRWWDPIVRTEEVDTIDQATLVRVYGLNTLSVVSEGGPYTELGWVDEEETAAFVKKGNFVGITLETLLSDKVQAIRTLPTRLASAWYNTVSALVSGVFTVNSDAGPALADTGALFNNTAVTTATGHANLLTAALNYTNYGAARTAMMKQTDQYSGGFAAAQGQRLLIKPKFVRVPVDLESAANAIFNSAQVPGSANNDINPYFKECQVVVDPHETDANNWALIADPNEFPAIWLIFLRGRRVPELFTAGDEAAGAMFTNDTLRYKVRMLTFRFSATYDCAPVSDFRPLHKNNVA